MKLTQCSLVAPTAASSAALDPLDAERSAGFALQERDERQQAILARHAYEAARP